MRQNVAYMRVSTESQTEKYGLDVQRQKIEDYANARGIVIDKWYVDGGYSGAKMERPAITELLASASQGNIGTVYVYKLDRMSRDTIDTLSLMYKVLPEYGVKLVSMTEEIRTENPMDKVMITMNAAMNQYEREVIRMRMSAGMVERVKKGYWMGGHTVPYGYTYDRNDGILHVIPEQAENVRTIFKAFISGKSCQTIARLIGFSEDTIVKNIIKRKTYIGLIEYKGQTYKGLHEPIIDNATFDTAQECLRKRTTNAHINNDNLLTGLCYCGICGARMRYQKWGAYHKLVCYSHYNDSGKAYMSRAESCDNMIKAELIEAEVVDAFKQFTINLNGDTECEQIDESVQIKDAIKKVNTKIKRLYSVYGESGSNNLLEVIADEEIKVRQLEKELEIISTKENKISNEKLNEIKQIASVWDYLSRQEQNKLLKECIERITIVGEDVEIRFII